MSKMGQRIAALAIMLAIVVGGTYWQGSKSVIGYQPLKSDAPIVMTVNGSEVNAEEFATYMVYNMKYYENMYAQYGMVGLWSDEGSAEMLGSMMPDAARDQAVYARVVLEEFEKAGLKIPYNQQKEMTVLRQQAIDNTGGYENYCKQIAQLGFNDQTYTNFLYITQCFTALSDYYYGPEGVNAPSEDELKNYFRENYLAAKHILITTADPVTGEQLRTDEEAKKLAQGLVDRVKAGEDFDQLMKENSEDPGLQGNPDGYVFTEGEMVQPFYDGAKALEENGVSAPIKSDVGYHVIKRVPLDVDGQLANYQLAIMARMGKTMDALLAEWMAGAKVETTDTFNEINYKNVNDYLPQDVAQILREQPAALRQ